MPLDPENDETVAMGVALPTPRPSTQTHRFAPGTLLASRYRIVSRLGKGGMGEVFRAEDIMLGQPVALKFLPENASRNVNLLTRFYDEVRIARQISHANVCRVYDIGEIEGQPYLSMEYIDGEDLSSLLRRIGRLPGDKAAEFARKMCAGLAAAHAQGVLHRDIKPGNIMIDGRGEPRITDFGLAAVASAIEGNEIRNGTPAYMAPEQLEGREVTVQSDLYALGLVFHEMFTGKAAHEADTVAELTAKRKLSSASRASTLVSDLDPAVDRAIQACLDPDPRLRPKSALDLARMLLGGDPLAAALAAGQTPSPELVAASGSVGALSPKVGLAIFATVVLGLIAAAALRPIAQRASRLPLQNSPDVLVAKARDILNAVGYDAPAADFGSGYFASGGVVEYLRKNLKNPDWDEVLSKHPTYAVFWYRASPRALEPNDASGRVTFVDPDMNVPGMTDLILGLDGQLVQFNAVPQPFSENPPASPSPVDWTRFFSLARLHVDRFQPTTPQWAPLAATDSRLAWTGVMVPDYKQPTEIPIRVEAASFEGRPVYFQVIYPWSTPARVGPLPPVPLARTIASRGSLLVFFVLLIGALYLALHHWKTGRGDSAGAVRLGLAAGMLRLASVSLNGHLGNLDFEREMIGRTVSMVLFTIVLFWVFYMALEPWVRRSWPQVLIAWSRLLQGHATDPLVGRDALFGVAGGVVITLTSIAASRVDTIPTGDFQLINLQGLNHILAQMLATAYTGIFYVIFFLLGIFLLRSLVRRDWLAALLMAMGGAFVQSSQNGSIGPVGQAFTLVSYLLLVLSIMRLGTLFAVVLIFVANCLSTMVFTTDYAAWYGTSSWLLLATVTALALWGYRVSVAGHSLLDQQDQS